MSDLKKILWIIGPPVLGAAVVTWRDSSVHHAEIEALKVRLENVERVTRYYHGATALQHLEEGQ